MSRWWSRLLLWPPLALLLIAVSLPLTETGTGALIKLADRLLPLDIQHAGGSLAGQLRLTRLAWNGAGVRLELHDVVSDLVPACLWRSTFCFRRIQARDFDLELLPAAEQQSGSPVADEVTADTSLLEFPVQIEITALLVERVRVRWENGQWQQGRLEVAVKLGGSTVQVGSVILAEALLELRDPTPDAPPAQNATVLPVIDLPLELLVDELLMEQPAWDIYGSRGQLDSLALQGSWRNTQLQLQSLEVVDPELGKLSLQGAVSTAGQWPLDSMAQLVPADAVGWPKPLERLVTLKAGGNLAALDLRLDMGGSIALAGRGGLNALAPDLPFEFTVDASWRDPMSPGEFVQVPPALAGLAVASPLRLSVRGSLAEQVFQLQGNTSAPGYPSVDLHLAGAHRPGVIAVEELRLQDVTADNTLSSHGEIRYGEFLQWSAMLQSTGFELPPLSDYAAGRLQGKLRVSGRSAGPDWQLLLSEIQVEGTVNGLPALVTGHTGIDGNMHLAPSDLQARLNGADLLFSNAGGGAERARFDLTVDDLGRWQHGSRGQLALQIRPQADWQKLALSGSLTGIQWQALHVSRGEIEGTYDSATGHASGLALTLTGLTMAGLELEGLDLTADGNEASAAVAIQSRGDLEGELLLDITRSTDGGWAGQLAPTDLRVDRGTWRLAEPVEISWSGSSAQLRVAGHCWQNPLTRVCPGELLLGQQGSASLEISGGMEFIASLLPSAVDVQGQLFSTLAASWGPDSPLALNGSVQTQEVRVIRYYGEGESATVHWDAADAVIQQEGQGLHLSAQMHRNDRRVLHLDGLLPANREGQLAATLGIDGLQLANLAPLASNLAVLEGEITGSLRWHGTLETPLAEGAVTLANGRFVALGNPTELRDIGLVIEAQGDRAALSGSGLLGGGALQISGNLHSRPDWRLEMALSGERHELLLPPSTQMIVSEQLKVSASAGLLGLGGKVTVHEGLLQFQRLPAGSVDLSSDVVEVDFSGNVIQQPSPFDTRMDIGLLVEDRFRIVGDLVDTTVGGDLQLLQAPGRPLQLFGNLDVVGGELRAFQQRLRIQRGTISFAGTPENPGLDLRAQREISSARVVAGVHMRGTLELPSLEVFSEPAMPQAEAMSYLLRGRGLDAGASADGVAMALSLGAGVVNQSILVSELNRIPGLNNVAFGAEGTEQDTAATVGGYIGDRLYLSYGMGIYEPVNVLTARLYLQTRLWLEVVSRLENSLDLYYSFDID